MLELNGKPLLQHQIDALQNAGVNEIAVVTGYRKEAIKAQGISHRFENERWEQTNMVRSLIAADEWLRSGPCLVSYADIFYAPSAPRSLMQAKANIAITYDVHFWELWSRRFSDPLADLENFRLDGKGYIKEIGGRALSREEIEGQYMGLLYIRPQGWSDIRAFIEANPTEKTDKLDMTSLLQSLIKRDVAIEAIAYRDGWGEVDVPEDLALYNTENI
jgi:choline kinase